MLEIIKKYTPKITYPISKISGYLNDEGLITDLICKFMITFGVVLIIGGLYLTLTNVGSTTQLTQTSSSSQSAAFMFNWIPGIPFYMGDLSGAGAVTIGLISWILGVDFLLVGLGFWVRSGIARIAGLLTFALAAFFQSVQFLYFGFLGSPTSVIELSIDIIFVYLLFTKFDSPRRPLINSQITKTQRNA